MASFIRTIPAIYVPGAPPPPLPLLASQTDLFTNSIHPVRVFHEELIPTQRTKNPKSVRFDPYAKSSCKSKVSKECSENDDSELTDLSSEFNDSSSEDDPSDRELIPKPIGEVGRPGRGGYNLEAALNWKSQDFKKIRNHIHYLIEKHLDPSKTVTNQSPKSLQIVKRKAVKQFPELVNYRNSWPVMDFMHLRLHYTAGQHAILLRRVSAEVEAATEATLKRVRSSTAMGSTKAKAPSTTKKTRASRPTNNTSD